MTDDDLFAANAGPEAIAAALRKARDQRARWDRRVRWLIDLHATRTDQITAGTWPPQPDRPEDANSEWEQTLAAAVARRNARIGELIEASSLGTPDAVAMRSRTTDETARQIVARANGGPCCDMHNEHCEPPGDLCCWRCTEAAHNTHPIRHADGSRCVLHPEQETTR